MGHAGLLSASLFRAGESAQATRKSRWGPGSTAARVPASLRAGESPSRDGHGLPPKARGVAVGSGNSVRNATSRVCARTGIGLDCN